jgi:hypothetical protein
MRALGNAADSDDVALRRPGGETFMTLDDPPAILGLS